MTGVRGHIRSGDNQNPPTDTSCFADESRTVLAFEPVFEQMTYSWQIRPPTACDFFHLSIKLTISPHEVHHEIRVPNSS